MSVLDDVFAEEYERLGRMRSAIENELHAIPKGCLSRKKIGGQIYCYLQRRDGEKVISQFLPASEVDRWEKSIARRRQLEASLKECKNSMKKLERVL